MAVFKAVFIAIQDICVRLVMQNVDIAIQCIWFEDIVMIDERYIIAFGFF